MIRLCPNCNLEHKKRGVYCSQTCYGASKVGKPNPAASLALKGKPKSEETRRKMSQAAKGKPKPWNEGENNPNFSNKAQEPYREKFLASVRDRGQAWGAEHRQAHSERMKTDANWMRGKKHSDATRSILSEKIKRQFQDGRELHHINTSKAEKDILGVLQESYPDTVHQYRIEGVSYVYDFFIPSLHLIVEYNGTYWHADPRKYSPDSQISNGRTMYTAQQKWERDADKRGQAEALGYNYLVLWESDYKKHGTAYVLEGVSEWEKQLR